MRIITRAIAIVAALLTACAVTAVAQESVGTQVKEAAKETGEAIKDMPAKTVRLITEAQGKGLVT